MAAYRPVDNLIVTCGLTACTPGSAPGPTLDNEYGKPLPLLSSRRSEGGKSAKELTNARQLWQWSSLLWCDRCWLCQVVHGSVTHIKVGFISHLSPMIHSSMPPGSHRSSVQKALSPFLPILWGTISRRMNASLKELLQETHELRNNVTTNWP